MARPSKWMELDMPSKLEAVTGWAKQGSTNEEIAKMLGVSLAVLYDWKNKYPEFKEAIKKGKVVADGELLNSAFLQSTGFRYTEEQAIKVKCGKDQERIEIVEVEKFMPPNPTMSIFMLKNRLPEQYKDKRETAITDPNGEPFQITIKRVDSP